MFDRSHAPHLKCTAVHEVHRTQNTTNTGGYCRKNITAPALGTPRQIDAGASTPSTTTQWCHRTARELADLLPRKCDETTLKLLPITNAHRPPRLLRARHDGRGNTAYLEESNAKHLGAQERGSSPTTNDGQSSKQEHLSSAHQ